MVIMKKIKNFKTKEVTKDDDNVARTVLMILKIFIVLAIYFIFH